MTTWTKAVSPAIKAELDARDDDFAKKLDAVHAKGIRTQKGIAARQQEAFETFRAALIEIEDSDDPTKLVDLFCTDASGNNYYLKASDKYRAYYFMQEIEEKGICILLYILYATVLSEATILADLEAALRKYRENHV